MVALCDGSILSLACRAHGRVSSGVQKTPDALSGEGFEAEWRPGACTTGSGLVASHAVPSVLV